MNIRSIITLVCVAALVATLPALGDDRPRRPQDVPDRVMSVEQCENVAGLFRGIALERIVKMRVDYRVVQIERKDGHVIEITLDAVSEFANLVDVADQEHPLRRIRLR